MLNQVNGEKSYAAIYIVTTAHVCSTDITLQTEGYCGKLMY